MALGGAGATTSEAGLGVDEGGWARRRDAAEEDQCRGWLAGAPSPKENGKTAALGGVGRQSSPGMGGSGANKAPLELGAAPRQEDGEDEARRRRCRDPVRTG